jgi:hypothetical protein
MMHRRQLSFEQQSMDLKDFLRTIEEADENEPSDTNDDCFFWGLCDLIKKIATRSFQNAKN